VIIIEETKDLNEVKITGRKEEKYEEQALLARFKQEESKKACWKKKKGNNKNIDKQKHNDKLESSKSGGESSRNQGKQFDIKKV